MTNYNSPTRRHGSSLMIPSPEDSSERVIVGVSDTTLGKCGLYSDRTLSFEDKRLMAGAFATLAHRLPLRTYDLIDWIATDTHFNREAIAHYAMDHLGMKRVVRRRLA